MVRGGVEPPTFRFSGRQTTSPRATEEHTADKARQSVSTRGRDGDVHMACHARATQRRSAVSHGHSAKFSPGAGQHRHPCSSGATDLPSWSCGFDSRRQLHLSFRSAFPTFEYLSHPNTHLFPALARQPGRFADIHTLDQISQSADFGEPALSFELQGDLENPRSSLDNRW